jgi:hypothetical protein
MSKSERQIKMQEEQIPQQAYMALARARQRTLDAGLSVVTISGNDLVEIAPDGSCRIRKQIAGSVRVVRGQKIKRAS